MELSTLSGDFPTKKKHRYQGQFWSGEIQSMLSSSISYQQNPVGKFELFAFSTPNISVHYEFRPSNLLSRRFQSSTLGRYRTDPRGSGRGTARIASESILNCCVVPKIGHVLMSKRNLSRTLKQPADSVCLNDNTVQLLHPNVSFRSKLSG